MSSNTRARQNALGLRGKTEKALTVLPADGEQHSSRCVARGDVRLQPQVDVQRLLRVVRELLPRLEGLARLLRAVLRKLVRERDAAHRGVRARREARDDPEARARARRGPEEVRVLGRARGEHRPGRGHDLHRRNLVREQAPRARGQSESALARVPADADVRARPVRHRALACRSAGT